MEEVEKPQAAETPTESMVAESGTYELLKKRLADQGEILQKQAAALNEARVKAFGKSEQSLILRTRARTENNCIACDIVRVGANLLFGYNVTLGLRRDTSPGDVFALYRLAASDSGGEELESVPLEGSFLDDARFASDFRELYAYYKQAKLTLLRVTPDKLFMGFRIGEQNMDLRVFRWSIESDGRLHYIDNRGERDVALPPTQDFEWIQTTRENHVAGKHPHINILDTIFVETIGGDFTIKIENNTETGLGILSEPVEDKNQSLADAEIAYAKVGSLILLRVRPYREKAERHYVYNCRTHQALRIDAIGSACIQLPEDHGVIFPGGYYLQSGEYKHFEMPGEVAEHMRYLRTVRSPNGEDVLYVFYSPSTGHYGLFTYNLINKTLAAPILSNGYARFPDGRILTFAPESGEPTRVHLMQLWRTPFALDDYAGAPAVQGFFGKIGNAELVRGISELMAVARAVREQTPTRTAYEDLIRQSTRLADSCFWLEEPEADGLLDTLGRIVEGAHQTLEEFEKVDSIRRETARVLTQAQATQRELLTDVASTLWHKPDDFVLMLRRLREQRGRLASLRDLRYIDLAVVGTLDAELAAEQDRVAEKAVQFLAHETAFDGYRASLDKQEEELSVAATTADIDRAIAALDTTSSSLDLLAEQLGSLPVGDAVARTRILDQIGGIYAETNRLRAEARRRRKDLGSGESAAEFGAQFKLVAQALERALDAADTPEKCDDALTRLLAQLEELEGRFLESERFVTDIAAQRETVYEAISARKQSLIEARQRRSQALVDAAGRILDGIGRRVAQLSDVAAVHAYFAGDPMLGKLVRLIEELRAIDASVAADELDTRLKAARDQAIREVRDRADLVGEGGDTVRFGRHVFSISRQPLDLTLVPRNGTLHFHLTGTDYFAPVDDQRLVALQPYWEQSLVSETDALYRAEYLAGCLLDSVLDGRGPIAWDELVALCKGSDPAEDGLGELVRGFAATRYQEGYQKGVHDGDASRILVRLVAMQSEAGLLAFGPVERAWAQLFWFNGCFDADRERWLRGARAAQQMQSLFGARRSLERLVLDAAAAIAAFARDFGLCSPREAENAATARRAGEYLVAQLAGERGEDSWAISGRGEDLAAEFARQLDRSGQLARLQQDLGEAAPAERWALALEWLTAFDAAQPEPASAWIPDAALVLAQPANRQRINALLECEVEGMLGEHARIEGGRLGVNLNDFWQRYTIHAETVVPAFARLQALRQELLDAERARLGLARFLARPLATFVRNRLIDEVYLPIVGASLARQIGTVGAGNRTDRMGMLLLISPPGYGKTTLMEYVADRLGLVFMRINCPVLGHSITGLDPASATHAAARQELEKLNLGLAMGSNVMLYLDDIQHTSPEFLQKFIALADGTRRIEGVWNGEARTYDLRGKRFALVMAGNPYTESGEVFKVPDMLANRADIYNLGDVLSGREALFALSYIENAVTSNPVLHPLASRDPGDVARMVRLAQGEEVASSDFAHVYSAPEREEMIGVMRHLFTVRDVLLKVNAAYIASAAQRDEYRMEPPFKLQGSYRNMNKLAAVVTPLMNADEMEKLLRDHYRGEAQTLTTGAEENLLRLAQLIGMPTPEETARWASICEEFVRLRKLGGSDDGSMRVANTVLDLARAVDGLARDRRLDDSLREGLGALAARLDRLAPHIEVTNEVPAIDGLEAALGRMSESYERVLLPLVTATHHKMKLDHSLWEEMKRVSGFVEKLDRSLAATQPGRAAEGSGRRGKPGPGGG